MTYAALLLLLLQDNLNVQSISRGVVAAVSADLSVYSLLRFRSRENWMIVAIITGAFCDEKGEQRQTPSTGAPSSNEQDLAVIKAYHVEILSMIGKQYLLHLTQKSPPHRELVIGVPPDSLWYYKSAQNCR
jgi:hypothetical protein